jgi:GT2 family glycosyltransferase
VLVSIVVPTFRRPESLSRAVSGLAEQERPAEITLEIVVVNNAPDTPLPSLAGPVRVIEEPIPGASRARNAGLAASRGEIVVFLDDDVSPAPGWLAGMVDPIVAGRCDATAGRVELDPSKPRPGWLSSSLLGYLSHFDGGAFERDLELGEVMLSASFAGRRDLFLAAGGFDERLGPRAGRPLVNDDVAFLGRVSASGGHVHYVGQAVVVHELPASRLRPTYLLRRTYDQGRSDWQMASGLVGWSAAAQLARFLERGYRSSRVIASQGLYRPAVALALGCELSRLLGTLVGAASAD